jgi:ketosteroid isomerase-like protein
MSLENLTIVERIYEAWGSGATAETVDLLDPQIEIHPDPRSAWPGIEPVYHGYDGISRYLASIYAAFEDYRAEPERLLDAGERVLVLAIERGRGKFSGAPVEIRHTAHIWTLRDRRAVRLDVNWDRNEALEAVELEE